MALLAVRYGSGGGGDGGSVTGNSTEVPIQIMMMLTGLA
jgi:hypothetical protein